MDILANKYLQFEMLPSCKGTVRRCFLLQNVCGLLPRLQMLKMFGFPAYVVRLVSQIHSLQYSKLRKSSLGFAYIKPSSLVFTIV